MKSLPGFWLLLFLLLLPVDAAFGIDEDSAEDLFYKSNQAHKEGRYQDAADGYLRLLEGGHRNGHINYNLGNTYLRSSDLGRAILYYERARFHIPRDADLNFNLRLAYDRTIDAIPDSQTAIGQSFFWLNDLTLIELFWSFAVLNFAFFLILSTRLFYRAEWTYYLFFILLILALIAAVSFGYKWFQLNSNDRAVILDEEVNVLSGPDPRDTILFKLHEGAVVEWERVEDDWFLIHLPDSKRGWVRTSALESIRPLEPENL